MKHYIVNYSGGLSSHLAAHRIVEEVGRENATLLFCDTMTEDPDLYRFLREGAEALGMGIVWLCEGSNIWGMFRKQRFLGNSRVDPCSKYLKRIPADRWVANHFDATNSVRVFGYCACENDRLERSSKRFAPWPVRAPLTEAPTIRSEDVKSEFSELFPNIRIPRLYELGAPHNNCGGLCVKAGQKHFAWALLAIPDVYAEWEKEEAALRSELGDVSILRCRRGGVSTPLTLREFRLRIEGGGVADAGADKACNCFSPDDSAYDEIMSELAIASAIDAACKRIDQDAKETP